MLINSNPRCTDSIWIIVANNVDLIAFSMMFLMIFLKWVLLKVKSRGFATDLTHSAEKGVEF